MVEHDKDTMRHADHLIDMGPGAGAHGGKIVAPGSAKEVMENKASITGQYLSGARSIPVPEKRRPISRNKKITVTGARANNLQNVSADIPLGTFCCVTGVSGGGKSSLVIETLYRAVMKKLHGSKDMPGAYDSITGIEYIDKIIEIDQSPSVARLAPTRPPIPGHSRRFATGLLPCPNPPRVAISQASSRLTSKGGAVKPARATG